MKIVSYHQVSDEFLDHVNDLADGCRLQAPSTSQSEIPPLSKYDLSLFITLSSRLDRHPGQGFLERLRLAHLGVPEKE